MCTPCSTSGTTTSDAKASPKPGNSSSASEGSIEWVQIRKSYRRNTNEIQWHVKSEWKIIEIWKVKRRRWWTPTRVVAQGTWASPNSQKAHLVRKWEGHWTPIGCFPKDYTVQILSILKWANWNDKLNFLQSLEAGAQKTPDNLSGFLSGFWYNRNLHISGFRVSTDCSHKQFEQEFDNASSYLPAGKFFVGMYFYFF